MLYVLIASAMSLMAIVNASTILRPYYQQQTGDLDNDPFDNLYSPQIKYDSS